MLWKLFVDSGDDDDDKDQDYRFLSSITKKWYGECEVKAFHGYRWKRNVMKYDPHNKESQTQDVAEIGNKNMFIFGL